LTLALSTPATDLSAFSTRLTQDAQLMPSTGKITAFLAGEPFLTGAFMLLSFRN
jgi:hypothetical protein